MMGNKANGNKAVLAAIMAISVLASVIVPVLAVNENVIVGITSDPSISGAEPGDTATIPIIVYNVTDLGAGTLRVTYNSSVCNVTNVTAGDLPMLAKNISVAGLAIISAFDSGEGHTDEVTFASLEIEAIGSRGESSPLNITVEVLVTYGGYGGGGEIPAANISVSNGTFTILDMVKPSVTNPSANPETILNDNGRPRVPGTNISQLNVTVTDDTGVDSVTINLSSIGGSAETQMTNILGTDIWTVTINATAGINLTHNLAVNASDNSDNFNNTVSISLTVLRRGDVNRDNDVNILDALEIAKWTVGKAPDPGVFIGDVDPATGNEKVNILDALYIAKYEVHNAAEP